MNSSYDIIIVGAGLAGACAALHLSRDFKVLLVEAAEPAAGASGVAAGLVNPLMARKARTVWRFEAALAALDDLLDRAGASDVFQRTGVLRPATDAKQAGFFKTAARQHPNHADWMPTDAVATAYADINAPHGALLVRTGGSIHIAELIDRLLKSAQIRAAEIRLHTRFIRWQEASDQVMVVLGGGETVACRRLVLALGTGYTEHPVLAGLDLHRIKGQTIQVSRPEGLGRIPAVSGRGYIVPDAESLVLGSTYEHNFTHLDPTPEQSRAILKKTASVLPRLQNASILEARAGVRVTVPGIRLPMIGPLPGQRRTWVFTGLGSKGLLMAPLLASELALYLEDPGRIPDEVRVRLGNQGIGARG